MKSKKMLKHLLFENITSGRQRNILKITLVTRHDDTVLKVLFLRCLLPVFTKNLLRNNEITPQGDNKTE